MTNFICNVKGHQWEGQFIDVEGMPMGRPVCSVCLVPICCYSDCSAEVVSVNELNCERHS